MFGRYVYELYMARFLAGCTGGGLYVCIPLFVSDIAEDRYDNTFDVKDWFLVEVSLFLSYYRIRGTLGSILLVCTNVGILLSFIAGTFIDYSLFPYVMIAFPLIFLISFYFLPETPQYLLEHDKAKVSDAYNLIEKQNSPHYTQAGAVVSDGYHKSDKFVCMNRLNVSTRHILWCRIIWKVCCIHRLCLTIFPFYICDDDNNIYLCLYITWCLMWNE